MGESSALKWCAALDLLLVVAKNVAVRAFVDVVHVAAIVVLNLDPTYARWLSDSRLIVTPRKHTKH